MVDVDRVGRAQMNPVLGRVFVELQEHIGIIDDLGDRLGILGAVLDLERLDRDLSPIDVLGVVDVLDGRLRRGTGGFRQRGKDIGLLMGTSTVVHGCREHFAHRFPESGRRRRRRRDLRGDDVSGGNRIAPSCVPVTVRPVTSLR
jgi:hypothetical protein